MEEPSMEWQIQEYSSEENSGKVSCILNKGLKLGKTILVTGFLISSAPLLLPPLVVISAIGFACSIPFGLLFASYACTEKLMDKLLPRPTHGPLLLEFGTVTNDDEEQENEGFEEDIDLEKEEQELVEDTRGGVEVLVEYYEKIGIEKDVKESVEQVDEIVEEDIGEYLDEEDDEPLERNGVLIEGMRRGEEEEHSIEESKDEQPVEVDEKNGSSNKEEETPLEVTSIDVESCQVSDIKEDEKLVSERRGLLELIRDEGKSKTDNVVKKDRQSVEKMYGGAEEKNQEIVRHSEDIGIPFEDRNVFGNVGMEKPLKEIEQKVEHPDRETPKESKKRQEMGYRENVDTVPYEIKWSSKIEYEIKRSSKIEDLQEKKDIDSVLQTDKSELGTINVGSIAEVDQKPVVDKAAMLQGERAEDNVSNDIKQDFQLNREKEIVISSNADAREIADESGFDLFDGKNEVGQQNLYANCDTAEGEQESRSAAISSEKDVGMASNKVLYNEEKIIWEQIDAMRTIVGYKATPHATCIEEVKALYIFTGVEPPASFKNPSDLVEVSDKLRFLMSIVGVK